MEENKKQAKNRGGMSRAKWMLALSLCLCLISMVFSSALQSGFGSVEVKELKLMDPSGYAVSALLYRPNSATAENKAPCIITVEGWYNNKEMQDLFSVEYARRGYVVVAVDMHGHGDTDSTPSADLYSSAVGVEAAVEMAGGLPYVDTQRIGITGHSSGGAASNMVVAIDNQRETPLINAVLFQAATWVDDLGEDHSADFGSRSVGIIADKYDEFFFWTQDAQGSPVAPRDFLKTGDAKNFISFNKGAQAMKQDVQAGKYYEDGGAFRVIYQPDCTHPWVHFSAEAVGNGVDFFERALGAPNPLPASNQVWQWKTAFNFLGLVGVVMFLLSFVAVALDIPYFSMLRAAQQPQPAQVKGLAGKLWFWGGACGECRVLAGKLHVGHSECLFQNHRIFHADRPPYYGRVVRAERRVHRAGAGGLLLFLWQKEWLFSCGERPCYQPEKAVAYRGAGRAGMRPGLSHFILCRLFL